MSESLSVRMGFFMAKYLVNSLKMITFVPLLWKYEPKSHI